MVLDTVLGAGIRHEPLMEELTVWKGFRYIQIVAINRVCSGHTICVRSYVISTERIHWTSQGYFWASVRVWVVAVRGLHTLVVS